MFNKRLYLFAVVILSVMASFATFFSQPVYAENNSVDVVNKALLQGLKYCYGNNQTDIVYNKEINVFENEVSINDVTNIDGVLNSYADFAEFPIPNGLVGDVSSNTISCKELIGGSNGLLKEESSSILKNQAAIPTVLSTNEDRVNFLESLGYVPSDSSKCFHFTYSNSKVTLSTDIICAEVKNNIIIGKVSVKSNRSDMSVPQFQKKGDEIQVDCSPAPGSLGDCRGHEYTLGSTEWSKFRQAIYDDLYNNKPGIGLGYTLDAINPDDDVPLNYKMPNGAIYTVLENFTGEKFPDLTINDDDTAQLYVTYAKNYYGVQQVCGDTSGYPDEDKYIEYRMNDEGEMCYVMATKNEKNNVNGVDNGSLNYSGDNFESIIDWLKNYKGDVDVNFDTASVLDPELKPGDEKDTCRSSGAAKTLGWLVCPVLEWISDAVDEVYDQYVDPSLRLDSKLFTDDTGGGARDAWETFRNFANVAFIILLLVVIYSQLTGVGIDNYGLKKLLPKIIIGAILINLSYLICMILVDLSNILGTGLRSVFSSLGGDMPESIMIESSELTPPDTGAAVTGVALLAGAATVGAIIANPAMLLSILVAAVGMIVSIFFLFILLSAREAAVVLLVTLSPLAFACYMLPNAKKLFDKWWKFFEGLLLVYPIAGLLVGGGDFVSKILLRSSGDSFFSVLTAMIAGILPIFFIPSVLKSSIAAMGKIGSTISGFGDTMSKRTTGAVRNSDGYKNLQRMGLEHKTKFKAGYNEKTGGLNAIGRAKARFATSEVGKLIGSNKRQAALVAAARKNANVGVESSAELVNALAKTDMDRSNLSPEDYYKNQFRKAASKGDVSAMNASISAAVSSGYMKDKDIAKMIRDSENDGVFNFSNTASRSAWMRDLSTKYGNGFLATDYEMNQWMKKGGNGALGNYGQYAANNIGADDLKPEDITKLSGDALAGMIASGVINQSMAQRVMAMNPNVSADKKIMLGAAATGAASFAPVGDPGFSDSVDAFKNEAKVLAGNSNATQWTDSNGNTQNISHINASSETVGAWTSSTPQDVNIVQNFKGGGRQYNDVRSEVTGSGGFVDSMGNRYHFRQREDGSYVDDHGHNVNIQQFKRIGGYKGNDKSGP